jgi:EpsI family protein
MKRIVILIILTALASAAVYAVAYSEPLKNERLFSFPLRIGNWSGRDIHMQKWVFESLETRYAIMRDYRSSGGKQVNLAITWYDDKEIAFHAPESCLGGVGNEVKGKTVKEIKMPDSKEREIGKLLIEKNGERSLVYYYFINDGYITPDQTKLRAKILLKRLRFKRTSAGFVRMMAPIISSEEGARAVLDKFLKETLPVVIDYTSTRSAG